MKNDGLFCTLYIEKLKKATALDDAASGRMATLSQTWCTRNAQTADSLWDSFIKQAASYLEFVPPVRPEVRGVYPLYEDYGFSNCISVLYLIEPGADIGDTSVGRFYPAKLVAQLRARNLNWGILTDGALWRLYSTKSSRPYEDYVELSLAATLESNDEAEYGLFERFFHRDSFVAEETEDDAEASKQESTRLRKCRLDRDKEHSEKVLDERVKIPLLRQVDEILQYLCNGFIHDMPKTGEERTEEERAEIFESAVKLLYRCLFFFFAEARRLLPSDPDKLETYRKHSIEALCREAHKFRWGKRDDTDQYDLWKHLKGLVSAVNDGDTEYGIMGYDGGLFDDAEERFLGEHRLRNDFLARSLYLLAFVEPFNNNSEEEYPVPYEDLEVRHLGELYENILEYTVQLADADRIRRRSKKGVEILLASQTTRQSGDTLIRKGEVFFGESALERKQTGSYYTPESLVRFLNSKTIVRPLREIFEEKYRGRFNEFLEQARDGHDLPSRRGAAQSAAALVERFTEDEVLPFKVCDPAMGSGHFLLDTASQMAGLIVALLEEVPDVDGLKTSVSSKPNHWRRKITRHCLYGVDLNPLAVNLAKLSLWLNCFAQDHKLTFLDHHLRHGNSLVGIRSFDQLRESPRRRKDGKKKADGQLSFNVDGISALLAKAAKDFAAIGAIDEDDTEQQKSTFQEAHQTASGQSAPLANLYTAYLMDGGISAGEYRALFTHLAYGKSAEELTHQDLQAIWKSVEGYDSRHHFFHWPIEFPDVFRLDATSGFSATVGNPPWDIVKPNSQEFFLGYDPNFRTYKKQEANRVSSQLMKANPVIARKWEDYANTCQEQSIYFREPLSYSALGGGDINTFKLFLEQFFALLRQHGQMGIVVPSGLYTDQGCQPLRERFFNQSRMDFLYCFENRWPTVFSAVDGRFKFVLFGTQKGGQTDQFKCAFMEHNPERLPAIDENPLKMNLSDVKKFSPASLGIMEFRTQQALDITTRIYRDWPLLGDKLRSTWNVKFNRELDMTNGFSLLSRERTNCPLYEGKMIWQFDSFFEEAQYWCDFQEISQYVTVSSPQFPRLAHRRIASGTNERTLVSAIIPAHVVAETNCTVIWLSDETFSTIYAYLCGVLNSHILDFVIRYKIAATLNMFYMESLPVPRDFTGFLRCYKAIVARTSRLLCVDKPLADYWEKVFDAAWESPDFWYPPFAKLDYGPAHEREIRNRLAESARDLSPEWNPHCGVHDRLPDRRDTGDRAQLRAEIDAYVAHLYGLSREDFAYILDTFPVLKRKEEAAFGEFMSKRKCLEEYDRIGQILSA